MCYTPITSIFAQYEANSTSESSFTDLQFVNKTRATSGEDAEIFLNVSGPILLVSF